MPLLFYQWSMHYVASKSSMLDYPYKVLKQQIALK